MSLTPWGPDMETHFTSTAQVHTPSFRIGDDAHSDWLDLLGHLREGDTLVVWRLDRLGRSLKGTVTLIEKYSGTSSLVQVPARNRRAVHFQAAAVAVISRQTANRSTISVCHSAAVSRCRRGRKCGEMPEKADRNRCACPGEVKRFITRSRCRVG